jgi:gliding motility-associated-like protein
MKWLCLFFLLLGNNLSSQIIDSATLECGHSRIVTFRENPFVGQTYSWMVSEGILLDHWDYGIKMDFNNVYSDSIIVQVFGYDTTSKCITDTATFILKFPECNEVFIPNAFTPNGDGINDIFYIRGNINIIVFSIYNRWGENIFTSRNVNSGWDGTFKGVECPMEVYVYFAIIENEGKTERYKGNITLIR